MGLSRRVTRSSSHTCCGRGVSCLSDERREQLPGAAHVPGILVDVTQQQRPLEYADGELRDTTGIWTQTVVAPAEESGDPRLQGVEVACDASPDGRVLVGEL